MTLDQAGAPPLRSRLFLALALAMPFLGIWAFPLFDLDEGAFTASTTEMFLRGDFLSTWLHGAPRYDKPVLTYWLQALSASLFGFDEVGFRLPSALAACAWIYIVYRHGARSLGRESGVLVAVILAASLGPLIIAKAATADALLNLCLAAAGTAAWRWLDGRRQAWLYLAWIAMALGFLSKGPVALIIPGGTLAVYCLLARDGQALRHFFLDVRAWGVFIVVAAPWFIVLTWRDGPGFLEGFFLKHNLGRFSHAMENHRGSPFYYVPVLLLSLLPFTGLLFSLGASIRAAWERPVLRFGLLWFLLVFALFSASGSKLPHYLYYGYFGLIPALAWSAGRVRHRVAILLPAVLCLAILLVLPELLATQAGRVNQEYAAALANLDVHFGRAYRLGFGLCLALALASLLPAPTPLFSRLAAVGLGTALAASLLLLPAVGGLLQSPVREAGLAARKLPGPLLMLGMNQPSFQTYAGRVVERRPALKGDLVLTPTYRLDRLPPYEQVAGFRDLALVRIR